MAFHSIPKLRRSRTRQGFSLIEMLTVVCIIGILVGLAVMSLSANYYDAVTYTHDQRNAQELAEVCTSAQAAGLNFVIAGDLTGTINAVVTGGSPSTGAFEGQIFALPYLSDQDVVGAEHYLYLTGNTLIYHSDRTP